MHFFDAAAMLLGRPVTSVQASAARRTGTGLVDLVSATVHHGRDVLATHTHSFTHAHRCERQLMRLDYGAAEARVDGWIPIARRRRPLDRRRRRGHLRGAAGSRTLAVDGFRPGSRAPGSPWTYAGTPRPAPPAAGAST